MNSEGMLSGLNDVNITEASLPAEGQALFFESGKWTNKDLPASMGGVSFGEGTITDALMFMPQNGQVLTYENGYWKNLNAPTPPLASSMAPGLMSTTAFAAVQNLKTVATSGSYDDLSNRPSIKAKITELDDYAVGSLSTGFVLTWSGTKWTPQAPPTGGSGGGGSIAVKSQNTQITTAAATINFIGAGVSATAASGVVTVTVPGAGSTNPVTVASAPPLNPSLNDIWLKV